MGQITKKIDLTLLNALPNIEDIRVRLDDPYMGLGIANYDLGEMVDRHTTLSEIKDVGRLN